MQRAKHQAILMDTARGKPIRNFQAVFMGQPIQAEKLEASVQFPSILRAKTHPRFNCHGLTFGSRRTAIEKDDDVNRIMKDDGYIRVADEDALPGDCILYVASDGSIDHSGVVVSTPEPPYPPMVCSKWGPGGPEVIHPARAVPGYAINNLRYYRITP